MTWVQIQKAEQATWADYDAVRAAVGDDPPPGLVYHAAGEQENGCWQAVSIWESEADFERFRDSRLVPAAEGVLRPELASGPPPTESFEAKHEIRG